MAAAAPIFIPHADSEQTIKVTPALSRRARLAAWAHDFKLGTAGWRDLLDPADPHNLEVPFNSLTLALVLCARAQLALEEGLSALHVGGEVRPHTQEFIDLASRIYAAHGITVRLRPPAWRTTPIWLSSFGVFHEELAGGENFTASHSPGYKGGWKPMDENGMQLLGLADRIADRVRALVDRAADDGLTIPLAPANDPRIRRDFDPLDAYVEALRGVVPAELLAEIRAAAAGGFRAAFCTLGGAMAATAGRVFTALALPCGDGLPLYFTHAQERADYHGIGRLDGVDHGVDPGKWQVYKHVGAQQLLASGEASVFFIWDPDGDRFNLVTAAPAEQAAAAGAAGLEVDPLDARRCLVYFKPNQLYFLLAALRLDALRTAGRLDEHDWIVAASWPTTRSLDELAAAYNRMHGAGLRTFRVPVGFKHFGDLVVDLERQLLDADVEEVATRAVDAAGREADLGSDPRLLIMAEESGGAAFGPHDWLESRGGATVSLAPKEKDGMQVGVLALALAARLHRHGQSFAEHYLQQLERFAICHRFYQRRDVTLYDETLRGEARQAARAAAEARKQSLVGFFRGLTELTPEQAAATLRARLPAGLAVPAPRRVFWAGDGTLIEWDRMWFQLRASGTDAVLRYYLEGSDGDAVTRLGEALTLLEP